MTTMTLKKLSAIAVIGAALLTGCKTSEANYRTAYETARQKKEESRGIEGTIYEKIRNEAIDSRIVTGGDSIPVSTMYVKIADSSSTSQAVKHYNVAVAQFKQIFNARAMMERLRTEGYPEAFLLENAEPLYYVIAMTCDDAESAAAAYHKVAADRNIAFKNPYPLVIDPVRYPVQ